MVGLGHVGQRFHRIGNILAVIEVAQIRQQQGGFRRVHPVERGLQSRHAKVVGFVVGDRGGHTGMDSYFEREAADELGKEAVQGAHGHAVGLQEGGP